MGLYPGGNGFVGRASSILAFSKITSEDNPALSSSLDIVRFLLIPTRGLGFLGTDSFGLSCERFEMLKSHAIDPMPINMSSSATVCPWQRRRP